MARKGTLRVEAFTAGKDPERPDRNEDQILVMPGRAYAVIDGVTGIGVEAPGGLTTGQLGGRLVRHALAEILGDPLRPLPEAAELLAAVTARIAAVYREHGLVERLSAKPKERFAATLALVTIEDDRLVVLLVGDSAVRLNGREVLAQEPLLDRALATLRAIAVDALRNGTPAMPMGDILQLARLATLHGLARPAEPVVAALGDTVAKLRDAAIAAARETLPDVPPAEIELLVDGGIAEGQAEFQNRDDRAMGYAVLDGFAPAMRWVTVTQRSLADTHTIELFTDGYFKLPLRPKLADWEDAADEVERVDPHKLGRYASTKGSWGGLRTDDRSVVIVTRDTRPPPRERTGRPADRRART